MREHMFFSRYVEQFRHCNAFGEDIRAICGRFKEEFVDINCDIQGARLENDDLIDAFRARKEELREAERQVLEKASLISAYEGRLGKEV